MLQTTISRYTTQHIRIIVCWCLIFCLDTTNAAIAQYTTDTGLLTATFTPAPATLFAFDFSVNRPTIDIETNFSQLPGTIVTMPDHIAALQLQPRSDKRLIPYITAPPDTAQHYTTFECAYSATNHDSSSLLLSFPDDRGYVHSIEFAAKWITVVWQGEGFSDNKYYTTYRNAYQYLPYHPTDWHCIGIEISEAYLKIFVDGHFAWGIGKYGEQGAGNVYNGSKFKPQTFNISSKGTVYIRSLRLAKGITKPKDVLIQKDNFATNATAAIQLPHTVNFETGSAVVYPNSYAGLQQLTTYMRLHPNVNLLVAGHTDNMGETDNNQELSERRAAAVIAWLHNAGIAPDRLTSIGYGASMPLHPNDTEANRAANRRVELSKQ